MAKKKKVETAIPTSSELDAAMDGVLSQQAYEHGSRKIDADFTNHTLVIPFPGFCLEWLFGVNGCPLSRSWGLTAEPHVGKTAMLYEMIRWHRLLGGRGGVGCTEGDKDSQTLRNSIVKYDQKAFEFRPCKILEDWQAYIMKATDRVLKLFDKNPEYTVPICFGVDSYVGALCKAKTKSILEEGFATSSYATEAKLIGDWLRVYSNHKLSGNPITLVGTTHTYVNQQQGQMPSFGPPKQIASGGQKLAYMSAINLFMANAGKTDTVDVKGQKVRFSLPKNTLAGTKGFRSLVCGLYWSHDELENRQVTWWDWDEATTMLLIDSENFSAETMKGIKSICNIQAISGGRYHCKALGIPESEAVSASEMGKRINTDPEIRQSLRTVLNIYEHPYFVPRIKYEPVAAPSSAIPSATANLSELTNHGELETVPPA